MKLPPPNLPHYKFSRKKQKCQDLGPKMPYLGIFDQKYYIWVFLGHNFKRTIVIFQISTLKFEYLQNFTKKQKCQNLGPKMPYLDIFDQKRYIWVFLNHNFKRAIVIFKISTLKFVYLQNFTTKQKCLNSGQKMPDFGIFGLEF